MKLLVTILFTCFLSASSQAQWEDTRLLKGQLARETNLQKKLLLLNELSYLTVGEDRDLAEQYSRQALALATTLNNKREKAIAQLGILSTGLSKDWSPFALKNINEVKQIAGELKDDNLMARVNNEFGDYYFSIADYDKAIAYNLKALKYAEQHNEEKILITAKSKMAQVYQMKGDLPRAEKLLEDVIQIAGKKLRPHASIYHTLANVYGMQEKYDKALAIDDKAVNYCDSLGLSSRKSPFYDNMANCFMYSGQYDKAENFFLKCLVLDSINSNYRLMADTYLNLGMLYDLQNKSILAISYLKKAVAQSRSTKYKQGAYDSYRMLSKLYKKNGQADSAYQSLQYAYTYKDSILNEKTEKNIAQLQTIYDTEKKEARIKAQTAALSIQKLGIVALISGIIAIVLIGILFYRKRQHRYKMDLQHEILNQQQLATGAVIKAEEKERQRIAADLHDGVGQLVSAAKMNLSVMDHELNFKNPEQKDKFNNIIQIIDESCTEIRNVSHEMMPVTLIKKGFSAALKEYTNKIDPSLIQIDLHVDELQNMKKEYEIILFRVIQECVSNILKHAAATHVSISVLNDNTGTDVILEDNGKGFLAERSLDNGIGISNMKARINYLQGTFEIDSTPGSGTVISIHIPVQNI